MTSEPTDNTATQILEHPENWKTGDQPMTAAQEAYLHTLAREAREEIGKNLTKAEASKKIEELQDETGRGTTVGRQRRKRAARSTESNTAKNEPTPSSSAAVAAAAGAVGPGAVAAAQKNGQDLAQSAFTAGLSEEDAITLRRLAEQMGGTDALVRWLRLHADQK